jgi:hypothetical protein
VCPAGIFILREMSERVVKGRCAERLLPDRKSCFLLSPLQNKLARVNAPPANLESSEHQAITNIIVHISKKFHGSDSRGQYVISHLKI